METFHEQVMEPASKLATKIRTSSSVYTFQLNKIPFPNWKPLTSILAKNNSIIDVKTGKTLKPNTHVILDKDGVTGRYIIMLEPTLYRVNTGQEDLMLRQGVYLAEFDHPITKHK